MLEKSTLAQELEQSLKDNPYVRFCPMAVLALPEEVIITGQVRSYYQKQMAGETVLRYLETNKLRITLRNQIVVAPVGLQPAPGVV